MLGSEIQAFFREQKHLGSRFLGVFAKDEIQNIKFCNKSFAVVNTDVLSGEGFGKSV